MKTFTHIRLLTIILLFTALTACSDKEIGDTGGTDSIPPTAGQSGGPLQPTGVLRRPIDTSHPTWLVHIDAWNNPDPQAIIDLIPEDIRPYVIFNIAFSVSKDADGQFKKPADGYETAKSWLSICAENRVWAMVQASSGGLSHWPDVEDYADLKGSLYEEFYQKFPNFLGFNYAEQGWGFSTDELYLKRLRHFANLLRLSHEYGGYLTVSFFLPSYGSKESGVAIIKRSPQMAGACRTYPENFIPCEKFTQTNSFHEMESTSLGVFLSGYAGNYGIRFDQSGWGEGNEGLKFWNDERTFPPAAGALPVMEHMTLTGQTVMDGPELVRKQCFKEGGTVSAGDGYTRRSWQRMEQFDNISMDIFRKILDGTIRLMSRKEVVDRTKVVVVNDLPPTGATTFDPGYSAPATLFKGLYLMDEDGIQGNNRFWFKKTGRYPAIPTVADLADDVARSFPLQLKASWFRGGTEWSDIGRKQEAMNKLFPEEYSGTGMFAARTGNRWVAYNCYATAKTASIPFKYNTCDRMELEFGEYSAAIVKEYSDNVDYYLTNYTADRTVVTDKIRIYGSTTRPTYTVKNRIAGNSCTVTDTWKDGVLTITILHNGPLDLRVACAGKAANRLTEYLSASVSQPPLPAVYTGTLRHEAEYFDYKNISKIVKDAASSATPLSGFSGMGYLDFGRDSRAAVRSTFSVNASGNYSVRIRYRISSSPSGTVSLIVNDKVVAVPSFTSTGTSSWQTVSCPATLTKGRNTISLRAASSLSSDLYIDYIEVEKL